MFLKRLLLAGGLMLACATTASAAGQGLVAPGSAGARNTVAGDTRGIYGRRFKRPRYYSRRAYRHRGYGRYRGYGRAYRRY